MSHAHAHSFEISSRRIWYAIGLSVVFVAAEGLIGWRIGSLALISDAGHNLTDALALALSAFAIWIARKPATDGRTFGYHRVAILTALVNSLSLVAVSLIIFVEAIRRIRAPEPVEGGWMIWTALAAFIMNVWISYWLHAGSKNDLNIRSAYLHMVGDALASLGVVLAGIVVWTTGSTLADPIVSLLLGALILWSAGGILRESLDILLESVPRGIKLDDIERSVCALPGVLGCHDLHVWTISSGYLAASCHVEVADQAVTDGQRIAHQVAETLAERHGITHTTVQVEAEECHNGDRLCTMRRLDTPADTSPTGP
ncbi:MAG: cation transporter [Chthonomonadales bacterium]|nr:cation transporter [Chthonomonadales bacterium]